MNEGGESEGGPGLAGAHRAAWGVWGAISGPPISIIVGLLLPAHGLAALAARLGLLALALHRGLLVVGPALHLLEEALFLHPLLEGLQRRFDLVFYDLNPHEDLRAAAVLTCAAAR